MCTYNWFCSQRDWSFFAAFRSGSIAFSTTSVTLDGMDVSASSIALDGSSSVSMTGGIGTRGSSNVATIGNGAVIQGVGSMLFQKGNVPVARGCADVCRTKTKRPRSLTLSL